MAMLPDVACGNDASCMRVRVSSSWSESGTDGGFSFVWDGNSVRTGPYCEVEPTSKSVDGFKPPNIFLVAMCL